MSTDKRMVLIVSGMSLAELLATLCRSAPPDLEPSVVPIPPACRSSAWTLPRREEPPCRD